MKTLNRNNLKRSATLLGMSLVMVNGVMAQDTIEQRNAKAKHLEAMYNMAERAFKDGDIDAARQTLRALLAEKPSYARGIALQRQLKLNGGQMLLAKKKRIFNAVIIKEVDYKELTLSQAIRLLGATVEKSSGDKVIPNFVIQDPNRYLGNESISLSLKNVPAGTVLENLLQKTACTASFTAYTVNIKPRASVYKQRAQKKADPIEEPADEDSEK